jgi:ElaB/YqjD/DUF883 family membrane-anchored ribosome-binding protein
MNTQELTENVADKLDTYVDLERLPGREDLERVNRRVKDFVAERPVAAVLIALATGYVVGRILSRVA